MSYDEKGRKGSALHDVAKNSAKELYDTCQKVPEYVG